MKRNNNFEDDRASKKQKIDNNINLNNTDETLPFDFDVSNFVRMTMKGITPAMGFESFIKRLNAQLQEELDKYPKVDLYDWDSPRPPQFVEFGEQYIQYIRDYFKETIGQEIREAKPYVTETGVTTYPTTFESAVLGHVATGQVPDFRTLKEFLIGDMMHTHFGSTPLGTNGRPSTFQFARTYTDSHTQFTNDTYFSKNSARTRNAMDNWNANFAANFKNGSRGFSKAISLIEGRPIETEDYMKVLGYHSGTALGVPNERQKVQDDFTTMDTENNTNE